MTELSLIVPCYNEAQNVDAFYDRCLQVFEPAQFEVIFINDGSKDDTYKKLQHLHEEHSNVLVVNFSRNFGKEAAIYAGLHYATGTYLSIIDADLQQDPEIVKHMTEILEKKPDVDVVAAYQKQRHDRHHSHNKKTRMLYTHLPLTSFPLSVLPDCLKYRLLLLPHYQKYFQVKDKSVIQPEKVYLFLTY